MEKLILQPNIPECIALKFADGKLSEGRYGDQMFYTLLDGRGWYADMDVAAKINMLELRPREPFYVCKRMSGQRGCKPIIDVYRGEVAPQVRTAAEATGIPPTEVEVPQRPTPPRVPPEAYAGTGAVTPAPAPRAASQPPILGTSNGSNGHGSNGNGANGVNGHATHNGIPYWDVKTELQHCYDQAVEVLVTARDRAAAQSLPVQFTGEDLRQVAATLFIDAGRDRRTRAINGGC